MYLFFYNIGFFLPLHMVVRHSCVEAPAPRVAALHAGRRAVPAGVGLVAGQVRRAEARAGGQAQPGEQLQPHDGADQGHLATLLPFVKHLVSTLVNNRRPEECKGSISCACFVLAVVGFVCVGTTSTGVGQPGQPVALRRE